MQGPNFTGHITIDNCALPGEMIRLKKDQVKIAADQAFAANGYFWHIGKLKRDKDGKATTEFDERSPGCSRPRIQRIPTSREIR